LCNADISLKPSISGENMVLETEELKNLQFAKHLLENPGFLSKATDAVGSLISIPVKHLPEKATKSINEVTTLSLGKACQAALFTMKDAPYEEASNYWHKFGVMISGGVGGFFGVAALAIELPISTTIMLRSIADIARSEGESISETETQAACLEVFALGGTSKDDDDSETGYYATRMSLSRAVSKAVEYTTEKIAAETAETVFEKSAPWLISLINKIAEKFSIQVTDKTLLQTLPFVGAAAGATLNALFIDHYQDMAKGHFIVRRLERKYGFDVIKQVYEDLPQKENA